MARKKVRHLTMLLLKESITSSRNALKEPGTLTEYQLRQNLPFRGRLYVQAPRQKPPAWLDFVRAGVAERIDGLVNASTAAVLLIRVARRRFALSFGYGRNLLKQEAFERDFGLKVALNTVDAGTLRSVDARTFEDLTLHTRRQASRGSSFDTFGLNTTQDVLRAVTGKPEDETFARQVTGADALAIAVPADFADLGAICRRALDAYRDDAYKERFGFIDHLRAVRDPQLIAQLDDRLVDSLKSRALDRLHVAPPEPLEWERVSGFTYSSDPNEQTHPDLDIGDYLDTIDEPETLTVSVLKQHKIGVQFVETTQSIDKWSVYGSIVFEVELDDCVYVLSDGDWFEVAKTFADDVSRRLAAIPPSSLTLPHATASETEGVYNARVAAAPSLALLDRRCVRARDTNTDIEVCDLFTRARQFVHVKKKTRSATLSHLFAQGVISAEAFLWDDAFRAGAKAALRSVNRAFSSLIPDSRPTASDYEVIYAIITTMAAARWPVGLPFFSQLNLVNAADRLQRLGYKVSLSRIAER